MNSERLRTTLEDSDENTSVGARTKLTEEEFAELRQRARENVQSISQRIRLYIRKGLLADRDLP